MVYAGEFPFGYAFGRAGLIMIVRMAAAIKAGCDSDERCLVFACDIEDITCQPWANAEAYPVGYH